MSLSGYFTSLVLQILLLCHETVLQDPAFIKQPQNPSSAREGEQLILQWNYDLQGQGFGSAAISNVTNGINGAPAVAGKSGGSSATVMPTYQHLFNVTVSDTQATLTFLALQGSDSGTKYQLQIQTGSFTTLNSDVVDIAVLFPAYLTNVSSDPQTVNESTDLQLFCDASGTPAPDITWTTVFENGSNREVLHRGSTWNFPNISSADAGTYRCTADNGAGNPVSHTVRIVVKFSPRITLEEKNYVTREGNVYLHCQIEAYPLPTTTWKPCNVQESVCDNSFLNISNVRTPRANYTCTAVNELGQASATTTLVIGGKEVYLSVSIITSTSEDCTKGSLLTKFFKDEVDRIFRNRNGYTGTKVFGCRSGSIILDLALRFSMVVAEDFVICTFQSAVQDGKLGELSINASSIVGIPPVYTSTAVSPTNKTNPEPDVDVCSECSCNCTVLIAVVCTLVLINIVLLISVIWLYRKEAKRKERKYQEPVHEKWKNNTAEEMSNLEPNLTVSTQQPSASSSRSQYAALDETRRSAESAEHSQANTSEIRQYAPLQPSTRSWEIPREHVTIEKIIGKGAFGQVAKGTAYGIRGGSPKTQVAVKMLKAAAPESDRKDLLSELEVMKTLKPHPHVIKLLGCVTESEPLLVLIEYVPYGDLLGYLRKSRGLNDTYYKDPDIKPQTSLTSQQLMTFAWQIADGMSYLSSRSIIHRDLAARNVLVGEGETCKVTDFGMARDVQQEKFYERKTKGRLPVKWTAYEALLYGKYTTNSDVWSYGVLLYEIFTIGGSPYPRMDGRKIANLLQQGYRMLKPKHVDDKLYSIMMKCWQEDPNERPAFADLRNKLKQMENQHKRLINMKTYDTQLYANVEDLVE